MEIHKHKLESYQIDFIEDDTIRLNMNENYVNIESHYNLNKDVYDNCYNSIAKYNNVSKENILVTNGSSEAIRIILHFVSFNKNKSLYGIVILPTYDFTVKMMKTYNFNIKNSDVSLINKDINEYKQNNIVVVYIDTPNNPTGYTWSYEDIEKMVEKNLEVLFIIDEAYIEFSNNQSCSTLVLKYNNIIVTKTFSKAFAMADNRIGYLITDPVNIHYIKAFANPLSVTRRSMEIATKRLNEELPIYLEMTYNIMKIKEDFINKCKDLSIVQDITFGGGNFIIIHFKEEYDSKDIYEKLLLNNIIVRHKSSFQNGIRVTISNNEEIYDIIKCL